VGERREPDGGALIAVGDVEYEFAIDSAIGPCTVRENLIGGSVAVDEIGSPIPPGGVDAAAQLNFVLPNPDWESQGLQPPQIGLDDRANGVRWQAGGLDASQGVETDQSEIVSWTLEDGRADGTATFLDLNAHFAGEEAASVPGRFLIDCAP
jgi:hypothetical protein